MTWRRIFAKPSPKQCWLIANWNKGRILEESWVEMSIFLSRKCFENIVCYDEPFLFEPRCSNDSQTAYRSMGTISSLLWKLQGDQRRIYVPMTRERHCSVRKEVMNVFKSAALWMLVGPSERFGSGRPRRWHSNLDFMITQSTAREW